MKTTNMPGFTAEDSLYTSRPQYNMTASQNYQKHHLNSALLVQRNVVPQLPIKLGQVCGKCIPESVTDIHFGVGMMECCDFWCDPPKGSCWRSNCAKNVCSNGHFDNIFDIGGGAVFDPSGGAVFDPSGGINTGGGVFNPGGGFNTGGGVFSQ